MSKSLIASVESVCLEVIIFKRILSYQGLVQQLTKSLFLKMDSKPVCVNDFERLAKHRLSEPTYNYFSCGTTNEVALRDNINSFAE